MNSSTIRMLKDKYPGIQLETKEILLVAEALADIGPCDFLVFGMGNDTPLWMELNGGGRTVFLEDKKDWLDAVTAAHPGAEGYPVSYGTKISEWEAVMDDDARLTLALPDRVRDTRWDVILVDGPSGDLPSHVRRYGTEPPGRMASIYTASLLVKKGGCVFVHDCDRLVERVYADRYLFDMNLAAQTATGRMMRKYRIM